MSRGLTILAALVFAGTFVATLPTDALVRAAIAQGMIGPGPTWERAHWRPWGIRLEHPTFRLPGLASPVVLTQLDLMPSLRGLLGGRAGRPWRVALQECSGTADGVVDSERDALIVKLSWRNVDLARCAIAPLAGGAISGRAEGTARLRVGAEGVSGEGGVTISDGAWRSEAASVLGSRLAAVQARAHWRLDHDRMVLESISLTGPDFRASGGGLVELAPVPSESRLAFRLAVAAPGNAGATWPLALAGTLGRPEVVTP